MINPEIKEQLNDLRGMVAQATLGFVAVAIVCAFFAQSLFHVFAQPLLQLLGDRPMIATEVASPFFIPLKFSLAFALVLSLPWFAYQVWRFIAPGLFITEKRFFMSAILLCLLLFYAGILFAYLLVMPLALSFFVGSAPVGVAVMTDINDYLGFALKLLLAFGFIFQVPVLVMGLVRAGLVRKSVLQAQRPYIIIGAFTLGMLLTPPDIFSQTLLALPLWFLYELGLYCSKEPKGH